MGQLLPYRQCGPEVQPTRFVRVPQAATADDRPPRPESPRRAGGGLVTRVVLGTRPPPTPRNGALPETVHAASRITSGKPCAGNPHARFERRRVETGRVSVTAPPIYQCPRWFRFATCQTMCTAS